MPLACDRTIMFGDIIEIERAKRSIGHVRNNVAADADASTHMKNDGAIERTIAPLAALLTSVREKLAAFRQGPRST